MRLRNLEIKNRRINQKDQTIYDMFGDKTSKKFEDKNRKKLEIYKQINYQCISKKI